MELPTIAFSKDFLALLKMSEQAAYAMKPIFASRCEKYSTTARYLERAVVVTQAGELIVFDTTDKQLRITHRIQIGKERPHKKQILQVDRQPYEKDMKQSIRLLSEPLSPTDDEPRWDPTSGETEEEFQSRIRAEDAAKGKLLPDDDLILTFHCKRGPITTQLVSIIRHYSLPIGDFYVELQDEPILKQVSRERSFMDVIRNLTKGRKSSAAKSVALNAVARQKLAEAEEAGEEVAVPEPMQAPRMGGVKTKQGGSGATDKPMVGARVVTELDTLPDAKEGITMRHIESKAKLDRQKSREARRASGVEVCDDDYEGLDDDELVDHLPQYTFDEPDPEDVEATANRKRRPQRPRLEEMEFPSEDDGLGDSDESEGRTKRKLKTDKKDAKRAKKEQEKLEKKRKEREEKQKRKESKKVLAAAIAKRESDRIKAGYRYDAQYSDTFSQQQPEPLYRARHKKTDVPLFIIRAPSEEDSLALTSLCFYRRNIAILLNPAMAPDDQETVSVAIASAGQFLVCRTHETDAGDDDLGASGRGFPLNAVTKCRIEYSNRYTNDQRIGYVTLTIDVNMNPKKAKKRKEKVKRLQKKKAEQAKRREKRLEKRKKDRRKNHEIEYDEGGNPIDDFPDDEEEEEDEDPENDEDQEDEQESRRRRHSDDSGSDAAGTDDEEDLRTVEMEFDDISCGDMNAEDAECCSLEYFVTVVQYFSPDAVIETEEPPVAPPPPPPQARNIGSFRFSDSEEHVPASALMAERLVSTASLRAAGREGIVPPEEAVTYGKTPNAPWVSHPGSSTPLSSSDVGASRISTPRLTSLTPQAIKERGDALRKMIHDHKQRESSLHPDDDDADEGETPELVAARSRQRTQQHRALTKLIFEISERNLRTLQRRASISATVGAGGSPSPGSRLASLPSPQALMRFRDKESRTVSGAPPPVVGGAAGSPSGYPFPAERMRLGGNAPAYGSSSATTTVRESSSSVGSGTSSRQHIPVNGRSGGNPTATRRQPSSSQATSATASVR